MKKILLMGCIFVAANSNAQNRAINSKVLLEKVKPNIQNLKKPSSNPLKLTRASSRWYDPLISSLIAANGDTTGLDANTNSTFLWKDTTMLVRYGSGATSSLGGIYLKSMAQIFDPFASRFNSSANNGELEVKRTDPYTVDSIAVAGFYRRISTKPNIVDSLIIHVGYGLAGSPSGFLYTLAGTNGAYTYGCYNVDTMRIGALDYNFNSLGLNGANVIRKAIPLKISDSGSKYFQTAVNLNVPAGNRVAMSIDFKSGDTWIPNVDTVGNFNFFRAFYTEESNNALQDYKKGDFNSTHSLDGDTTGWGDSYIPNYFYIGTAGCVSSFDREQYWTLYKLTSNSKTFVSINDIQSQVSVSVSPNPASEIVTFDMNFSNSFKAATITLTNMTGQVVKTVQLGNVTANSSKGYKMNLADLTKGLYIYTIIADGQSQSGKLSVN